MNATLYVTTNCGRKGFIVLVPGAGILPRNFRSRGTQPRRTKTDWGRSQSGRRSGGVRPPDIRAAGRQRWPEKIRSVLMEIVASHIINDKHQTNKTTCKCLGERMFGFDNNVYVLVS